MNSSNPTYRDNFPKLQLVKTLHGFRTTRRPASIRKRVFDMSISRQYYKEVYPRLKFYALSKCGDKTLADDLVSDTILRAIEKADENLTETELTYWCLRVLKNDLLTLKENTLNGNLTQWCPEDETDALKTEQMVSLIFSTISACQN